VAKFTPDHTGIRRVMESDAMERALRQLAEPVQDEAVRITAAEAVDTGLMAASWRLTTWRQGGTWRIRIYNRATNKDSQPPFAYPLAQELGWRTRNGRHIPGKRILGRALAARLR
jgi:hypothetical protein